ncbi:alpha/beta hydrolase [Pontibacter liquoris]|uniref:alpha/beta hydrolase n=1 Tax=Pontibacter liquoris TaxID=2905677 RepID=UPI001FA7DD9F|nr:alpha/beta hydrolase-fold protein [Pontibacter liquoris]
MLLSLLAALLSLSFSPIVQNHTGPGKLVRIESFPSRYVAPRQVDVWLPESYGQNPGKKYAVLYMQDGQNLFSPETAYAGQEWQVDETLSQLMQEGKIKDCIVVGIWNTAHRFYEYGPQKPFALLPDSAQQQLRQEYKFDKILSDEYLKFIVEELKPYIDKKYCTRPDRNNTYLLGSSMGGLISLYGVLEYPKVFGGAACLSTHWPFTLKENNPAFTHAMAAYLAQQLPTRHKPRLYFDYGTQTLDAWYAPHQQLIDSVLEGKGYGSKNWVTRRFEGAEHSERSWRERLAIPVTFLLRK